MQLSTRNSPICPASKHDVKFYNFCQSCANHGDYDKCFFCKGCSPQINRSHGTHQQHKLSFTSDQFQKRFSGFKGYLQLQYKQQFLNIVNNNKKSQTSSSQTQKEFKEFLQIQPISYKTLTEKTIGQLFNSFQYREWMIKARFWQFADSNQIKQTNLDALRLLIKKDIDEYIKPNNPVIVPIVPDMFTINWGQVTYNFDFVAQCENAKNKSNMYQREIDIINFLLQLYASFSIKQCETTLIKCQKLIEKYVDQVILYFAKIRLCELIPGGNAKIQGILNQISCLDQNFKTKAVYFYFMAIRLWTMILPGQQTNDRLTKFLYEPKNKMFYAIDGIEQYIQNLNKAISISPTTQAYYAARGIGYIVQKKYKQAAQDFQIAQSKLNQQNINFDNIKNNLNYAEYKQQKLRAETVIEGLANRSRQYIVNAARFFKKKKQYENASESCRILLQRQPNNEIIQKQLIKCLVSGSVSGTNVQDAEERLKKLTKTKIQQKTKLERRIKMAKGRILWADNKSTQALAIFGELAENGQSATALYNYAVALYENEKYSQALLIINKALELKNSNKFHILKMYLCCHEADFQTAGEQLAIVDDGREEFKPLIDYLRSENAN